MVDHEQAVLGAALDREVADEVVVVAELLLLGGGGLRTRIESRRARQDRVAPADQDVGLVAGRHVMVLVDASLDFGEAEAGVAACGLGAPGGGQRQRRHRGADRGHGQRALAASRGG